MKDLLTTAYKAMEDRLASDIVVIDFRNQSPFVDYFIIASARNQRMAASIIDNVEQEVTKEGYEVRSNKNTKESKWYLIDLDTVVCHVFYDDARQNYNLEGLWKDLPIVKM